MNDYPSLCKIVKDRIFIRKRFAIQKADVISSYKIRDAFIFAR